MSATGSAQQAKKSDRSGSGQDRSRLIGFGVLGAGALLTALLLGYALGPTSLSSSESNIAAIAPSELDAAAASLYTNQAAQRVADAKTCKAPLAILIISKAPGSPDATIRIGSGDYVSPPFKITEAPQQVAVPFPAPFPVGKGVISVLGEGKNLTVWMTPGWTIDDLTGIATRNVIWDTTPNC